MTDQKPPAQPAKPVSAAPVAPPAPKSPPLPQPPSPPRPAGGPPPLPKPNFSVTPPAQGKPTPKPPAPKSPPLPKPPASPKLAGLPKVQPPSALPSSPPKPQGSPVSPPSGNAQKGPDAPPSSTILQAPPAPKSTLASKLPQSQSQSPSLSLQQKTTLGAAGGATLPKPPTPPSGNSAELPPPPPVAEFKKSPLRFLPLVVALLLVLGIGYFVFSQFFAPRTARQTDGSTATPPGQTTVLTYWGLWEPTPVLEEALDEFESQNPGIKVNYIQQNSRDYRERLQTAIASGRGPDVFRFHASWTPMLRAELSEMPTTVYSPSEFQQIFYPIVSQQLRVNNAYVGVPLMYDGIALFYNREALRTANAQPPQSWAELKELASRLTIRSGGKIERAGLAIGTASNIDHFAEVLALLMIQNGADPSNPTSQQAVQALQYYTDFYTKDQVWDKDLPNSVLAFSRGEVAMIFAPSWRVHDIMAMNPNLSFGVTQVPQVSSTKVTYATYWAEGVNAQSRNKDASWKLIKYLSSPEALEKMYSEASTIRSFGEIYPRVDMADSLAENQYVAPYLADAPFAKAWYMNSFTHDNGLNDQVVKYYGDAINAVSQNGQSPSAALTTANQGIRQVLRQYNLTN